MEEVIQRLLVAARRRAGRARAYQLECLEIAIPEGEKILKGLSDPEFDRSEIHRELADFVIRLAAAGVFERLAK